MAGETIKTEGIALKIRPWSQTSHVVTWLTRDHGIVSTIVKGAVRPKSAFLGQYDLFYTCELVYYARAKGDLHALREAVPTSTRDGLRGRWRETAIAGYAALIAADLAPGDETAAEWFDFMGQTLDRLAGGETAAPGHLLARTLQLELGVLKLAGLSPDLSDFDPREEWQPFALDGGHYGEGIRTVRLSRRTASCLARPETASEPQILLDALRFVGVFLSYHLGLAADVRRDLIKMVQ